MQHVCGEGDVYTGVLREKPDVNRLLERPRREGRMILKWIFKKWYGVMDWIDVAQDRDRWRAVVNAVTNLQVPQNVGNFLAS
jgi:hypothetical protein